MLMIKSRPSRAAMAGFSLVELMVGSVIGLIVIGAVTALVLSMMRSNRQTLQATRLNQELRATLAVIANDIKRARSVEDPFTIATAAGGNPYEVVDSSTAGCVRYAYSGGPGGDWRSIRRDTTNQRLVLSAGSAQGNATCATTGTELGSDQVLITAFDIQPAVSSATARRYDITITGRLNDPDTELSGITRTMRQTVFIRSIGDGT
ncbi:MULTISPECIES: prepilin-type N-terminal cleavage/methylation domain-containing protein [unclassified Lysobacter]|uniref:PilW family protein n=1 Tax=unclassified Lysobacter TaxID=2635362 RepID=UPI001F59629F|nr:MULTISPECIES: prepilin-type N-terminal cleavage/methylation domain-containing protein [unclassified Lysobacter]